MVFGFRKRGAEVPKKPYEEDKRTDIPSDKERVAAHFGSDSAEEARKKAMEARRQEMLKQAQDSGIDLSEKKTGTIDDEGQDEMPMAAK